MKESFFGQVNFDGGLPESEMTLDVAMQILEILERNGVSRFEDISAPHVEWDSQSVTEEFFTVLHQLEITTGQPLPKEGRKFRFVTPRAMKPKTQEERDALIEAYGAYMVDGGAGDCRRNKDGSFGIRIGMKGREKEVHKSAVLALMAHEYGHTLGQSFLDGRVFEELKAYAFSSIVMDKVHALDVLLDFDLEKTHEASRYMLALLHSNHVPDEAIISHLINEPFMGQKANGYQKYL